MSASEESHAHVDSQSESPPPTPSMQSKRERLAARAEETPADPSLLDRPLAAFRLNVAAGIMEAVRRGEAIRGASRRTTSGDLACLALADVEALIAMARGAKV